MWPGRDEWKSALCEELTSNMNDDQWRDWVTLAPDEYVEACPGLPPARGLRRSKCLPRPKGSHRRPD
jgi:hypothetical protein